MQYFFSICDARKQAERQDWIQHWQSWERREVFAHPDYVRLYLQPNQHALSAIMSSRYGSVLYPFIYRDLTTESYWQSPLERGADITSPYGYGGPFCWNVNDIELLAREFWDEFSRWTTKENIVSEFIRFSLFTENLLPYVGTSEARLKNIVRSLDMTEEEIWMDYRQKVRKNVRRAQQNNLKIKMDDQGEHLNEFMKIYYGTMERRSANDSYYFTREYFEQLGQSLSGQYMYFHAIHSTAIISTELVLVSADNIYSFLGGTDKQYFDLRPNDLLKHHIINWAKSQGKKCFVLGGGYDDNDGIYQYKETFAPNGQKQYYIGQRILQPYIYKQLTQNRLGLGNDQLLPNTYFFPAYRA